MKMVSGYSSTRERSGGGELIEGKADREEEEGGGRRRTRSVGTVEGRGHREYCIHTD